jgi:hypothetical protein
MVEVQSPRVEPEGDDRVCGAINHEDQRGEVPVPPLYPTNAAFFVSLALMLSTSYFCVAAKSERV